MAKKIETKVEVKEVEYQFNPKKLQGAGAGIWKYLEDPELVTRETFTQGRAKDFGIKASDIVFISLNGIVKTIGV